MNEENIVNIREFLRNYKKFKNKTHIIANHGKPELVVIPYKEWKGRQGPKITLLEALDQIAFKGNEPDLSQKIDEVVYGAPNPYRKNDNS